MIDWLAVVRRWKRLEHIFKPATLVTVLIGAYLLTRGPHDTWVARFFLSGLALSLAGDIILMLPERFFTSGLVAFLLAHLCYIVGLNQTLPPWPALALAVVVAAIGLALYRSIAAGLRRQGKMELLAPVALYSLVLSLMLLSAWATLLRPEWAGLRRVLVIGGGSLFTASDTMLAWERFIRPSPRLRLTSIATYHLAQIALAASIAVK